MNAVRAELRRLGRWPALWILSGVWWALNLTFGYVFPYLTYKNNGTSVGPGRGDGTLALLLPAHAPIVAVQGLPLFGGALVVILGALAAGSGYGWGTWKTVFTTGPRREVALGGTFGALAVILVALTVSTIAVDLAASTVIGLVENQTLLAPTALDLARGAGAALLIGGVWLLGGVLLGTLTRGPALAVGLGLVWTLVVENLLRAVANVLGPLKTVTDVLPGTAAGSVAAGAGALPEGTTNGTPGVNTILGGGTATWILVAYLVVFAVATLGLVTRRDLAG